MIERTLIEAKYSEITDAFFGEEGIARDGITVLVEPATGNGNTNRRLGISSGSLTIRPRTLQSNVLHNMSYELSVLTRGEQGKNGGERLLFQAVSTTPNVAVKTLFDYRPSLTDLVNAQILSNGTV